MVDLYSDPMTREQPSPVAVITGASSGIGAATAKALAQAGFRVVLGARRIDRLASVAAEIGDAAHVVPLDVTDAESIASFAAQATALGPIEILVANAGGALGADPVVAGDDDQWRTMWETNVLGVVRTVRSFLPALEAGGNGRIVVLGSVAGHQVYPGGGGYSSAKHAVAAVTDTLRIELLGKPIRVTEIAPGAVQTEFALVRLGDQAKADAVYAGLTPLVADDIADAICWAVTRPAHVAIARIDLFPRAQAGARDYHREL